MDTVTDVAVRPLVAEDWPAVRDVYAEGIATGDATFEREPPEWPDWHAVHHAGLRLVAEGPDGIVGWAAASEVSDRCCYAGVVEDSVYFAGRARGRGVGRTLLAELVQQATAAGIWTIQAGIFPENVASIALHEACGFRVVGVRERLGQLEGRWRDVVLMERRSPEL